MEQEITNPFQPKRIFAKSKISNRYDIYLDGSLTGPENYREEIETIRNLGEEDVVFLHMNGPGGDAMTAVQFINAIKTTSGTVVCSAEGQCASAYTFIFLSGHGFDVAEHTEFMCHNYSAGAYGKGHELWASAKARKGWARKLMRETYEHFMTEKEINQLIKGKDYYFSPDEVLDRCQRMIDMKEAEMSECEDCCGDEETQFSETAEISLVSDDNITDLIIEGVVVATYDHDDGSIVMASAEGVDERELIENVLTALEITFKPFAYTEKLRRKIIKYIAKRA